MLHSIWSFEYLSSKGFGLTRIAGTGFVSLLFSVAPEDLLRIQTHQRMMGILH